MKTTAKILYWTYLTFATISLIIVSIYLFINFSTHLKGLRFESAKLEFDKAYSDYEKKDNSFKSLFNIDSDIVIEYINAYEQQYKYINYNTKLVGIDNADLESLERLFQKWPTKYQKLAKENLVGIFILDTARFNGQTQFINSTQDKFIIFLNRNLFRQTPNDWITKHSTEILKKEDNSSVKYVLYEEEFNKPINTVEHVLIHEFSHVFAVLSNFSPSFEGSFSNKEGYYPLIESCFNSGFVYYDKTPLGLDKFRVLSRKNLPESQKIDIDNFVKLNNELTNTLFPTPYSTKDCNELVAENLTLFIHHNYLNQRHLMIVNGTDTIEFAKHINEEYINEKLK